MNKYKTSKLKDVAELAGVSIATANQVLNNFGSRFSETTCRKVINAAEKLSYRPNFAARSLRSNKSYTIGILFFSGNSLYMSDFMHAVQYSLVEYKYAPIFLTHSNKEEEERNLEICMARHVDGLVVNPCVDLDGNPILRDQYQKLAEEQLPVIEIFGQSLPDIYHFYFEHAQYGYELTERLYQRGCRKIGFLTHSLVKEFEDSSNKYWNAREMWLGYQKAIEGHGLKSLLFSHHLDMETETEGVFYWNTYKIADHIFSKESGLDGIVCFNEEQAFALVNYGNNHGVDLNKFIIATVGRSSNRILSKFAVEQIEWPIKQLGKDVVAALMQKLT